MRPGGGKSKGAKFERQVCVTLSRWVTSGRRKDVYWRSAMSGGRATVNRRGAIRQDGDVCAVGPEGHSLTDRYLIECKFLKDLDLHGFLIDGNGKLAKIWLKLAQQATRARKEPMLIAKQNRSEALVIVRAVNSLQVNLLLHSSRWNIKVGTLRGMVKNPY